MFKKLLTIVLFSSILLLQGCDMEEQKEEVQVEETRKEYKYGFALMNYTNYLVECNIDNKIDLFFSNRCYLMRFMTENETFTLKCGEINFIDKGSKYLRKDIIYGLYLENDTLLIKETDIKLPNTI